MILALATCVEWAIALGWASRAVLTLWKLRLVPDLSIGDPPPAPVASGGPLLTVIVPARNEAASIGETLRSVLASDGVALEVVAINDRSTDATGAIMRAVEAAAHGQLRVLEVTTLPSGWMGKSHAMALAARDCTTPYLLFTDGDILFAPDALARAMRFVLDERADHLVLMPTLMIKSFGERMMLAAIQVLGSFGPRLWKVADPRARDSIGVGAFNLVRNEAYRAVGGFEGLRMEVVEDLRLGYLLKHRGFRQRVAFGPGLVRVHWATGALGIVHGLTKNLFALFRFRLWQVLLGILFAAVFGLAPVAGLWGPAPGWSMMRAACLVSTASMAVLYARLRPNTDAGVACLLLMPLAVVLLVYAMLRSVVVTLAMGGVSWRGTRYPLAELRRMAGPLR